jgi:3-isopropylmalate/(R)-2-methylmalate dehydratase large subunit
LKFFIDSLSEAASLLEVKSGNKISIKVDIILGHDGSWSNVYNLWKQSNLKMSEGNRFIVTVDHAFPAPTIDDRVQQQKMAEISREKGIELYNHGEGVLHQVVAENVNLCQGMIIVGADGHVATSGAFGAIAFSLSPEALVKVLKTGEYEFTVPYVVTISLDGKLNNDTMARDIALYILGTYGVEIKGKAIALRGSLVEQLSVDSRMALCNLLPEAGVVTAFIVPKDSEVEGSVINIDVSLIKPMVAVPPEPTLVKPVKDIINKKISIAIIGGCSSGRLEDMIVAAEILKGKEIHNDVTLIVTPASKKVVDEMEKMGITSVLRDSGAVIMPPGCGTCPGRHFGVLSPTDVAITTTIRNTPGRMGAKEAEIYLASPISVAKAAIKGVI